MTHFIKFVLAVLLSVCLFLLVIFLNIKIFFGLIETSKNILRDSNAYALIASGIRDNLAENGTGNINKDDIREISNEVIGEKEIQEFIEDANTQFYNVVTVPGANPAITLHFSLLQSKIEKYIQSKNASGEKIDLPSFAGDRNVDLSRNPFVLLLININKFILGACIAAIVFILLLLLGGSWSVKLAWLGIAFLLPGLLTLTEVIIFYYGNVEAFLKNVAKLTNLHDEKFLLAANRIVNSIFGYEKTYYLTVTIILLLVGIVLIVASKFVKSKKINIDDFMNEKKKT